LPFRPGGPSRFDEELYLNFTIEKYAEQTDLTGDFLWEEFQSIFDRLHMMYQYLPIYREFFFRNFDRLFEDGILRWELRTSLDEVYDVSRTYTQEESLQIILDTLQEWKLLDYPKRQQFTMGIIIQGVRALDVVDVSSDLIRAYNLRSLYPDVIIGFDLVGHEDPGETLLFWAPTLLTLQEKFGPPAMPYFFHAGESNRVEVQENLLDALLLNASRIGHGFGIQQFPSIWPLLRRNRVLIESCPISNQMLGLIVDQWKHPVGQMLRHAVLPSLSDLPPSSCTSLIDEVLSSHPDLKYIVHNTRVLVQSKVL
jgi:adenosine deaminase CECR1